MHEGSCEKGWRDSPTQEYNALQRNQAEASPLRFTFVDPPTKRQLLISGHSQDASSDWPSCAPFAGQSKDPGPKVADVWLWT
jgi:hypothetical protein